MASKKVGGTIEVALKKLLIERAAVDDAIVKLQSLLGGARADRSAGELPKRRGRPPKAESLKAKAKPGRKVATVTTAKAAKKDGAQPRSSWSPAARRKAAERMREYWAKQRKQKSAGAKTTAKRRSRA